MRLPARCGRESCGLSSAQSMCWGSFTSSTGSVTTERPVMDNPRTSVPARFGLVTVNLTAPDGRYLAWGVTRSRLELVYLMRAGVRIRIAPENPSGFWRAFFVPKRPPRRVKRRPA